MNAWTDELDRRRESDTSTIQKLPERHRLLLDEELKTRDPVLLDQLGRTASPTRADAEQVVEHLLTAFLATLDENSEPSCYGKECDDALGTFFYLFLFEHDAEDDRRGDQKDG